MENKIQQLTEKLYNDGVSKGKQESEKIIAQATAQSAEIIAAAEAKAAQIVEKATTQAQELTSKSTSELKSALSLLVEQTKASIEKTIVSKTISKDVKSAFNGEEFIKELILTSVKAWGEKSSSPLAISASSKEAKAIEAYLKENIDKTLNEKITISPSTAVKGGFNIAPQGEGYYIKFTSEDFDALLKESLRAQVAKILFGE